MAEQFLDKSEGSRGVSEGSQTGLRPADTPVAVLEEGSWTAAYFRGLVRGALRKIYFRWPGRKIALDRVRQEVPGTTKKGEPTKKPAIWYKCEQCGVLGKAQVPKANPKGYVRVWVDHKDPVVPLDRYPDWKEYIDRLFCSPDNFEVLCQSCHDDKSRAENEMRRQWRKNAKPQKTPSDT